MNFKKYQLNPIYGNLGAWSFFGLLSLLTFIAWYFGFGYFDQLGNLLRFAFFDFSAVPDGGSHSFIEKTINLVGLSTISLIASYIIGTILVKFVVKLEAGDHMSLDGTMDMFLDKGAWVVSLIMALEELIARWIPLGVIPWLLGGLGATLSWNWLQSFASSTVLFYVMMYGAGIAWALYHLTNFTKEEHRKVVMVLPQFVGVIVLGYVFAMYGPIETLVVHFLYNVVLMSSRKERFPNWVDLFNGGFYLVMAIVTGIIISNGIGLQPLVNWLNIASTTPISEIYSYWEFFVMLLFVSATVDVICYVLLLDRPDLSQKIQQASGKLTCGRMVFGIGFTIIFYVLMVLILNWVLSWFGLDYLSRAAIFALLLSFTQGSSTSGSSLAKMSVAALPTMFLIFVAFTGFGFWASCGMLAMILVIEFIPTALNSIDS